jgi:HTH-type transcriptional regulator/antitoxin HigA
MNMDIRPIKSEADYEWALAEVSRYFDDQPEPGSPDGDRFDVLATLVEAYENAHFPLPDVDPVDILKAYMEAHDYSQRDFASLVGSRSRASEILNRRRALNLTQIHKIVEAWKIPAELLIKPYPVQDAA